MNSEQILNKLINKIDLTDDEISFTHQLSDVLSINNLSYMYYTGSHPDGKNITKAVELCNQAVKLGNSDAMSDLSFMYYKGSHPDGKNIFKAVELCNQSIKLGNSMAINNLAVMYQEGDHPNGKNITKAVELYNQSIKLGNKTAMNNLAFLYCNGNHPDGKNITKAIELYEKSIELGNNDSMENLSDMYKNNKYNGDYEYYYNLYISNHGSVINICKPKKKLIKIFGNIIINNCPICHDTLMNTPSKIIVTTCGHAYHFDCLNKYNGECCFKC